MEIVSSRDKIVIVAQRVFGRLGFNKTTMTDIANAAKRGRRTIYTHFKSKEDVYEAVIEKEVGILNEELKNISKENTEAPIRLKHYILRRMITIRNLLNYHEALKKAFFEEHSRFACIRKKFDDKEYAYIHAILRDGIEKGDFINLNEELTVKNIMITIKAFEMPYFKDNYTKDNEKQLNNILDILLFGICQPDMKDKINYNK